MAKQDEHNEPGGLGDRFDDFEYTPSDHVWTSMESELKSDQARGALGAVFENEVHAPHSRVWNKIEKELHPNRRRAAIWWYWGAAAAGILLLLSGYWMFSTQTYTPQYNPLVDHSPNTEETTPLHAPEESSTPLNDPTLPEQNLAVEQAPNQEGVSPKNQAIPSQQLPGNTTHTPGSDTPLPQTSLADDGGENSTPNLPSDDAIASVTPQQNHYLSADPRNPWEMEKMETIYPPFFEVDRPEETLIWFPEPEILLAQDDPAKWRLAGQFQPYSVNQGSNWTASEDAFVTNSPESSYAGAAPPDSGVLLSVTDNSTETRFGDQTFLAPLNFGMTFNRKLTRRFSLESGFSYTILRSTQQAYPGNGLRVERNNQFRYIGLPITTKLAVIDRRKVELYWSNGFLFERAFRRRILETTYLEGEAINMLRTKVDYDGGQISYSSGLGLGINFTKRFSFYLEPAATVYLRQRQANFFSYRTVWPSFRTGIRISL